MPMNLESVKAQHAKLLAALLLCDSDTDRARVLRSMMRELEHDMRQLEQARIMEMAARLKQPDAEGEAQG